MKTNLSTIYLGKILKNPIIVGASHLTSTVEGIVKLEKAGAGAVVTKSLFEEELQMEFLKMEDQLEEYVERHAEMTSIFPKVEYNGLEKHLLFLRKAVQAVDIPVFASLNAVSAGSWIDYAKAIAKTGVSGIELNLYHFISDIEKDDALILADQLKIIKDVKNVIDLPISVKIGPYYGNIMKTVKAYSDGQVDGVVLFNKIFTSVIDIHQKKLTFPMDLSNANESRMPIRYTGLLYGRVEPSICTSTGILSGEDLIRAILAGANCVQMVSSIYLNGIEIIQKNLKVLEAWMTDNNYIGISEFRGTLSKKLLADAFTYERAQYIDLLNTSNKLFKEYQI